jgi:hypothetical protein
MSLQYYAIPRDRDTRPVEQRTCDTCQQTFDVRVPSVGQDWTTCAACQTREMLAALGAGAAEAGEGSE